MDDCTPEVISYLSERLMNEGALDVQILTTVRKKGRLGFLIRLLVKEDDAENFSKILMEETGTLGVRVIPVLKRYEADREIIEKEISISGKIEKVRVKKSKYNLKPEFDDVRRISLKYGLPYREVLKLIEESLVDN